MPRNKVVYSKELNGTYILDDKGNQLGWMEGDHRNNPLAYDPNVTKIQNVEPPASPQGTKEFLGNLAKDAAVDAGMLIPGMGQLSLIPRLASEAGIGMIADRLLNSDRRSFESSVAQVGTNALINEVLPFLVEHKLNFRKPAIRTKDIAITTQDPTITTGSNTGESNIARTENINLQRSGTAQGTSQGVSSGERTSSGTSSNESVGTTTSDMVGKRVSQNVSTVGEPTERMIYLEDEISRLKDRLTNPKYEKLMNAGKNREMVTEAIDRNQTELDELVGKNTSNAYVTDTHNVTKGEKSTSSQGKNVSSGTSTSVSKGSSTSQTTGTTTGTNTGTAQVQSSGTKESVTTPGTKTTTRESETTGSHIIERLAEMLQYKKVRNLSPRNRTLLQLIGNLGFDVNQNR